MCASSKSGISGFLKLIGSDSVKLNDFCTSLLSKGLTLREAKLAINRLIHGGWAEIITLESGAYLKRLYPNRRSK